MPNVLFAESNGTTKPLVIPNDEHFGRQWNLRNTGQYGGTPGADIKAPEAWDIYTGNSSNIIAVVDGGIDNTHPDLSGKVSGDAGWGWNGHGIHVAGIASAKTNNTTGVAGVDWNAQLHAQRVDNTDDAGTYQAVVDAVNYSANVRVLNNSWGLYPWGRYSTTVRLAFAYAYKMNRVAAAAMGNNGTTSTIYPAGFGQGIIAVGATTVFDSKADYSNMGNHIDVSAPGGYYDQNERQILSTCRDGYLFSDPDYEYMCGTSMATPHVSGIASLLKGYNSNLYNDDIEQIIRLSADDKGDPGFDTWYGTGRVNALKALRRLRGPFTLTQSYVMGGTDQGASNYYQMTIYGAQALGLPDGTYWVRRHEVRQAVTFPTTRNVAVWGRGVATNGWADEGSVNFTYGWCETVNGTITSTGATLRTFVYEVYDSDLEFLDCYPTTPNNVRFEYTVHGIPATITSNTTWEGVFSLDGNVTVNSGVTLTINAGTSIAFANADSLTSNGILTVNGTSGSPVTFTSVSGTTAGSWGSLILNGSGASGSNLNNVIIQYGTEVQVINVPSFTIQNSTIENMVNGVYCYGSNGWLVSNHINYPEDHGVVASYGSTISCYYNTIQKSDNSGAGILFSGGSYDYIYQNDISGFNWGIGTIWGSSPYMGHPVNYYGKSNRIQNCLRGFEIYEESYPLIGLNGYYEYVGNSVRYQTNSPYVLEAHDCEEDYIYAQNVYWGGTPYYVMFNTYDIVGLNYSYWLTSDPWDDNLLARGNQRLEIKGAKQLNISPATEKNPLLEGIALRKTGDYSGAIDLFKGLIVKNPRYTPAFIELYKTANDTTIDQIIAYFTQLPDATPVANKFLLSNLFLKKKDVQSAKEVNDVILKEYPGTSVGTHALLNKLYIAMYNENDPSSAKILYSELSSQKEKIDLMEMSLADHNFAVYMKAAEGNQPGSPKQLSNKNVAQLGKLDIVQNYPNPFNPSTEIKHLLPRDCFVTLKIYNALGQEVRTIVNEFQKMGEKAVTFNATGLSSGIYFYRLIAGSETVTKKMLMVR
jgi:subtilisin family serine protease/tetratricopeptide (TPR) repeat protein